LKISNTPANHLDTAYQLVKKEFMEKRTLLNSTGSSSESTQLVQKFASHVSTLGKKELELTQKKLQFLCLEFDPYQSDDLSSEEENIIHEYELENSLGNPFEFTNIVLQMLDTLETEIKSRSH
tara:strand:- start:431 stop:799 length:369 start_codon:yes stop_codon:yes gene_type:complete